MRTTLTLDDDLMSDAATYSGLGDKSKIVNLALDHYIKWMAGRRLAALGGTMPDLVVPDAPVDDDGDRHPSKVAEDPAPSGKARKKP